MKKQHAIQATLIPASQVAPSTYNPRSAKPERLALIALSLRKLGFLLPLYATAPERAGDTVTAPGEIISGHQRHLVATHHVGYNHVPVVVLPRGMALQDRKALNIVFNRGTNDLGRSDTEHTITESADWHAVRELGEQLPDIVPGTNDSYRCLHASPRSVPELVKINRGRWIDYARNLAGTLEKRGIIMPVVVDPNGLVVNGIGRLQLAAEKKRETVQVVEVTHQEAEFARAMLNLLSMDFDVHTRYADVLRHNSFRRSRTSRKYLGLGFIHHVHPGKPAHSFDITASRDLSRWTARHGRTILDFGAGHLHETKLLQSVGLDVTPFEPYHLSRDGQRIDQKGSRKIVLGFLHAVATGKRWSSLFISSVLNSVPFLQDRQHLITLLQALASPQSGVYGNTLNYKACTWQDVSGRKALNETSRKSVQFKLDYEPGIALGDIGSAPKVQKYHTVEEARDLFANGFSWVRVTTKGNSHFIEAHNPKRIDAEQLAAAIAFEFDLPYPDGSRMGLVREARVAFERRLGIALPSC